MRQIPDQLKSRNLVPFKKRNGKHNLPGMASTESFSCEHSSNRGREFWAEFMGRARLLSILLTLSTTCRGAIKRPLAGAPGRHV